MRQTVVVSWLQLTHKKSRLLISTIGVIFAVALMFITIGIRDAIFDDSITIHNVLQADLFIQPYEVETFYALSSRDFPRRILYSLAADESIESVAPFYLGFGIFQNAETLVKKTIPICAFQLSKPVFSISSVNQHAELLRESNVFIFDRLARPGYGPIVQNLATEPSVTANVSGKMIRIKGLFEIGGGILSANGLLITSDSSYAAFFDHPLEKVNMGMIQLKSGADLNRTKARIAAKLPRGIQVLTREEFMQSEKRYWQEGSPIGFIFTSISMAGLIFGGVIIYQILFTQISDYLSVYATFKAIGYTDRFLAVTVIQEGFLMSIIGYIPGLVMCSYLYALIKSATRLPLVMTLERCILIFFLTIIMCVLAGLLSINKLKDADPAELFR